MDRVKLPRAPQLQMQTIGVIYMVINCIQNSLVGIFFKLSYFEAAPIVFMIGSCGSSFAVVILAADSSFKNLSIKKLLYFKGAINGVFLGGGSNFCKYFAMDFINASESLVILFFMCTVTAILLETIGQSLR